MDMDRKYILESICALSNVMEVLRAELNREVHLNELTNGGNEENIGRINSAIGQIENTINTIGPIPH